MIRLPQLEIGGRYSREEVGQYIATQRSRNFETDDYNVVHSWFLNDISVEVESIEIEYAVWPMRRFADYLPMIVASYGNDRERIETIKKTLQAGECVFPVWIIADHANYVPVPVKEGNHRLLAFSELGMADVPVFLAHPRFPTSQPKMMGK